MQAVFFVVIMVHLEVELVHIRERFDKVCMFVESCRNLRFSVIYSQIRQEYNIGIEVNTYMMIIFEKEVPVMTESYIPIINGKTSGRIKVSDVVMVERINRKIRIVTGERDFNYYERLDNVAPLLDQRFYPCLKGCYINFEHVSYMANQQIHFDNGEVFYLGRENFLRTRQRYKLYLRETFSIKKQIPENLRKK